MTSKGKHSQNAQSSSPFWRVLNAGACLVGGVCLIMSLVAVGFAVDAYPTTTVKALSTAYSDDADSPFTKDELITSAIQCANFTAKDNDLVAMYDVVADINLEAQAEGRSGEGAPDLTGIEKGEDGHYDTAELEQRFAGASDRYVLDAEAISHLNDCFRVISKAQVVLLIAFILAIACIAHVAFRCSRKALGLVLAVPSTLLIVAFALVGAWIAIDFDGMFAAFHSLFFTAGSWYFSWDSLLICMYPTEFWIGMGAIWCTVTIVCSIICLIIGIKFIKQSTHSKTLKEA